MKTLLPAKLHSPWPPLPVLKKVKARAQASNKNSAFVSESGLDAGLTRAPSGLIVPCAHIDPGLDDVDLA
jgi:hypothetical protein